MSTTAIKSGCFMMRKIFVCFALSLLPLFSLAQVLMDDVSEEELKAAFQHDCDQVVNWGDPSQTCLSARYQQWNAMGGYSDGYAKSWAEPMVLAYRTELAEANRKLEAIAEAERQAEAARIAEEERIAAITAREQQTKIETEEALKEFSLAADPELTCDLLSPPLENDEDFVRSISGSDEYGIPSNVPYLSLGNSTRACIADPCSYRCKVIFDWQLDPSSARVALDALVDSRLAAASAERAAQQAKQEAEAARLEAEKAAAEEEKRKQAALIASIDQQMIEQASSGDVLAQFANYIATGDPLKPTSDSFFMQRRARIFDRENCVVGYTDANSGSFKIFLNKFSLKSSGVKREYDTYSNQIITFIMAVGDAGLVENNLTDFGALNLMQYGVLKGKSGGNSKVILGSADIWSQDRVIKAFEAVFSEVKECTGWISDTAF